jgi:hypothetical protein
MAAIERKKWEAQESATAFEIGRTVPTSSGRGDLSLGSVKMVASAEEVSNRVAAASTEP